MIKKRVLTVAQYIDRRDPANYGKRIRLVGVDGTWLDHKDAEVERVKVTDKWVFIFVKE